MGSHARTPNRGNLHGSRRPGMLNRTRCGVVATAHGFSTAMRDMGAQLIRDYATPDHSEQQ